MWKVGPLSAPEASELNALEQRVQQLERQNVCPPLFSQRGPAGIAIGLDTTGLQNPDDPLSDSAKFVDLIHIVARTYQTSTGHFVYTCRRVDRGNVVSGLGAGILKESVPVVQYAGVYESQDRIHDLDTEPGSPSIRTNPAGQELPLYLDPKGFYCFSLDQNASGDALPGPGIETIVQGTTNIYASTARVGHVSNVNQVMGEGIKGFRRAVAVNLSRDAANTFPVVPGAVPAFRVLVDSPVAYPNALRVFTAANGNAGDSYTLVNGNFVPASGVAIGPRRPGDQDPDPSHYPGPTLTGNLPLTVDGDIWSNGSFVHYAGASHFGVGGSQFPIPTGQPGAVGGTFGFVVTNPQGAANDYSYSYFMLRGIDPAGNTAPSVAPTFTIQDGPYPRTAAYAFNGSSGLVRGINADLLVSKLGGGSYFMRFQGGLLIQVIDNNGTIIVGVDPPGIGGPPGPGIGPQPGPIAPPVGIGGPTDFDHVPVPVE